jgi:hypothetical protein
MCKKKKKKEKSFYTSKETGELRNNSQNGRKSSPAIQQIRD